MNNSYVRLLLTKTPKKLELTNSKSKKYGEILIGYYGSTSKCKRISENALESEISICEREDMCEVAQCLSDLSMVPRYYQYDHSRAT